MQNLGKLLFFIGLGLVIFGLLFWNTQKGKVTVYFPLAASLLISLILTIVINLLLWLFRK